MPDRYLVDWSPQWDAVSEDVPSLARLHARYDEDLFCALLGKSGPPLTEAVATQDAGSLARTPWVTLVLGSECLEIGAPVLSLDRFTAGLEKAVGKHIRESGRVGLVSVFARGLLIDRYPGAIAQDDKSSEEMQNLTFKEWEAKLLEVSALLNLTYYRAMAAQHGTISRWGATSIKLTETYPPSTPLGADQEVDLDHLQTRLEALKPLVAGNVLKLVDRVLNRVDSRAPKVTVLDLRAMTELAWQLLMKREASAQGWPELLVALSMHEAARAVPHGQPRPRFRQPGAVVRGMKDVLLPMTRNSIKHLYDNKETEREAAYLEYARLLDVEARVRNREMELRYGSSVDDFDLGEPVSDEQLLASIETGSGAVTPPASAIVTTFDVELELALARHSDRPFVVALPVDVMATVDGKRRAKGLWLAYVVRPPTVPDPDGLAAAILEPPASRWFVLSGTELVDSPRNEDDAAAEELPPLGSMPFIVRLTGSPLVTLPDLKRERPLLWQSVKAKAFMPEQEGSDEGNIGIDNPEMSHAVMLEENQALRWSLPELVQSSRRGLPTALTGANDEFWRYWTLVGVQLSDSVVRYRLMAELVAAGLLQTNPAAYRWPTSCGLAINRDHVGIRAAETLLWSEFEVVRDDCANLTERLKHYTDHLETSLAGDRLGDWPRRDQECELR